MASPSSVLTLGFGPWGSVNLLPTLGYGAVAVADSTWPVYAAGADSSAVTAAGADSTTYTATGSGAGEEP